jgi:negative regulator of flagellin synthesis FlgM
MVDRINAAPVTATERVSSARTTVPVAQPATPAPTPNAAEPTTIASALQSLVGDLAAKPPVDTDRVARIRNAIATNTYPLSPENVADRLIALKLNWIPHDPS